MTRRALGALVLAALLAACGKKGDLDPPPNADPNRSQVDLNKGRKN